jgi:hypothetical protein
MSLAMILLFIILLFLVKASDLNVSAAQKASFQAFAVGQMEYILTSTGRRYLQLNIFYKKILMFLIKKCFCFTSQKVL